VLGYTPFHVHHQQRINELSSLSPRCNCSLRRLKWTANRRSFYSCFPSRGSAMAEGGHGDVPLAMQEGQLTDVSARSDQCVIFPCFSYYLSRYSTLQVPPDRLIAALELKTPNAIIACMERLRSLLFKAVSSHDCKGFLLDPPPNSVTTFHTLHNTRHEPGGVSSAHPPGDKRRTSPLPEAW